MNIIKISVMKLINISACIFSFYACISKGISWAALNEYVVINSSQGEILSIEKKEMTFQMGFAACWVFVFTILILLWAYSYFYKSNKLKTYLVSCTIIGALFMSVTDNVEFEYYVSDLIISGEMLETR